MIYKSYLFQLIELELLLKCPNLCSIKLFLYLVHDGQNGDEQPKRNKKSTYEDEPSAKVKELRRQLFKLIHGVRKLIEESRSATEDFQSKSFHQLYDIISQLFSNDHSASIEMIDSTISP